MTLWSVRWAALCLGCLSVLACSEDAPSGALPSPQEAPDDDSEPSGTSVKDGGVRARDAAAARLDAALRPETDARSPMPATVDAQVPLADAALPSSGECPATSLTPGQHDFALKSANGISYKYQVVVPDSYRADVPTPVVFVWHALTSDPVETRALSRVDSQGAQRGAIMVYPESPDKSWDVGSCCTATVLGARRDEEVFARELVSEVQDKLCVDERRIYTTGFSNGSMLSQLLACKMTDVFAAAVSMSGTLTIAESECRPARPIPMMLINGTADPLVGYASPSLSGGLAVTDAFAFWGRTNGCSGNAVKSAPIGKATLATYQDCAAGSEVALWSIEGMGHCLARMKKESATNCLTKIVFGLLPVPLGPPNDDIDGFETALDFLFRWTRP